MHPIVLLAAALKITALVAIFTFSILLWRRTHAVGFAVLAALMVFSAAYPRLAMYSRDFFPKFEQFFYGALVTEAIAIIFTVVTALAWGNIYARISQLIPNDSAKPTRQR